MEYTNGSALSGLKVLDMGRVLAGPACTALLADLGADVIKLETPGVGDDSRINLPKQNGQSTYFVNFNRSKKGITLNLKKGKDVFLRLIKEVDVLVENFRPGVMKKLGLDYETLREINPGLIYAAVSGFGQTGPYSQRAGFDPVAQALSGMMSITGYPDRPPVRCGSSVADVMAGMNATIGILAALQHRHATGRGQFIDASLVEAAIVGMASVNQVYLTTGVVPQRQGNGYTACAPGGCYHAIGGEVALLAMGEVAWEKLCNIIGRPELLQRPEFANNDERVKNKPELDRLIDEATSTIPIDDLVERLLAAKMPVSPIYNIAQVAEDPHLAGDRKVFTEVDHPTIGKVRITNQPFKMSETNPHVRGPSPSLGEHNQAVYRALGYSDKEIEDFAANGTI
ncbi:CaiB/BaiF CoA transferase family protein [Rhodobium gokarnense]|uniref:Formyl-CoA transferase n=1 Tax=Rhodobium gokarnense TaxID=364296 RepID=A0ABT3H7Q1_9HYPH|nr:CoA transferase [Rhodobium gokarnense]MCW2306346.1 formyl-CoA transferase [Rhodobium gokarnense]